MEETLKHHFFIDSDAENKRYVTPAVTESTKNKQSNHYTERRMYQLDDSVLDPLLAYEKIF